MKSRIDWQCLALRRLKDAEALLDNGRWHAAYYLAGYAVECALKSCILRFVENTPEIIFEDKRYSEKCWKHDFGELVKQADLEEDRKLRIENNPGFAGYWGIASRWTEISRYDTNVTEPQANDLYEAISHDPDGVLQWLQIHW
ncbi:MAG: HEPN domain-containing protein [Pirellulales bacterium]